MNPKIGFHRPDPTLFNPQSARNDTHCSRNITGTICAVICITLLLILSATAIYADDNTQNNQIARIGVLAKRGRERCLEKWTPTARYLSDNIPGHTFEIVPLGYDEFISAVDCGEVEFLLCNPALYVEAKTNHGASRLITLNNLRMGLPCATYGGVIFCRADRNNDINFLSDLKGRKFMAVNEHSFGGWLAAWREMKDKGIDPRCDFAELLFGGTHDAVVYAVRDGKVDAGSVRTDTLERMERDGKIRLHDFHVIHDHDDSHGHMPFLHSTRPYPEWPFAKCKHTSAELAKDVAVALLKIHPDSPAAKAGRCSGWVVALNYQPVHECLKELRVGPYRDYEKVTAGDVFREYWYWMVIVAATLAAMTSATIFFIRLNRRLHQTQSNLKNELAERRRTENALKISKSRLLTLYEATDDGVMLLDEEGFFDCNAATIRLFGCADHGEFIGKHPSEFSPPTQPDGQDSCTAANQEIAKAFKEGRNHFEWLHCRKDGTEFPAEVVLNHIKLDGKDVLQAVVRDITERKQVEKQIAIFRRFADTSGQGFGMATLDGNLTYLNGTFCRLLGEINPEKAIGKHFVSYYHQEIQQRLQNEILPEVLRGEQWVGELNIISTQGEITPTITNFFAIRDQSDKPLYYAGVFNDITERKRVEEELRAAQAEVESLLASITSIMIRLDHDGLVTLWNHPVEKILGINADNAVGHAFRDLEIDWEWEEVTKKVNLCREKGVETQIDELTFKDPDGSEHILAMKINLVVESSGKVTGILISGADISERKNLEKQLNQAQKLESVGQLAAGIAHEINTPSQYVGDNTRFLHESFGNLKDVLEKCRGVLASTTEKSVTPETLGLIQDAFEQADVEYLLEEIPRAIEQSLEGIGRITRIVRAMKSFSHPGTEAKIATDLNVLIENTVTVCRNEWKYVSDMKMDLDANLPMVYCLPNNLNQVVLNLIMNAAQAIQEVSSGESPEQKGTITVSTKLDGEWVEIRIGDTGGGIPDEITSKVFDLFFTTKKAGKGTGQGLSITRDVVVTKHSGSIDFESQAGEGTTFIIRLPIKPPEMAEDNNVKEAANAA